MQNSDEPPEDLMSMDQHELETAHSRALIDAHDLKRTVLELDYDDECTDLARAEFNDAMERVVQIEVRGFERYGSGSLGGATRPTFRSPALRAPCCPVSTAHDDMS